jgi:integrase
MATAKIGAIRARRDRPGMYEATYYVSGKRRRVLGESREAVSTLVAGKITEAEKEPELRGVWSRDVTLKEYADNWIKTVKGDLEPKTWDSYSHLLFTHVLPFKVEGKQLADVKIRELKRRQIKALVTSKKADGYAKDTVRLIRSVLSSLLTDAQDDELIDQNPALMIFRKNQSKEKWTTKEIKPMEQSEFASFGKIAKDEKVFGLFLITLGKTGLRPSEAMALTPADVKFDKSIVRIDKVYASGRVRPYTKNGLKRDVDLSSETLAMLRTHLSEIRKEYFGKGEAMPEMLFPNLCGKYLDNDNASRAFHRICGKAKIGRFRMYDLRHTFASLLLASGAPITYVSAQLGHTKPTTTLKYYARWLPKEGAKYVHLLDSVPEQKEAVAR